MAKNQDGDSNMTKSKTPTKASCRQCGACCRKQGSPAFLPEEIEALPQELRDIVNLFIEHDPSRYDKEMPCYFWDSKSKRCRIYEFRPWICREFEPGSEDCRVWRRRARGKLQGRPKTKELFASIKSANLNNNLAEVSVLLVLLIS